jgi:hypothetical protein
MAVNITFALVAPAPTGGFYLTRERLHRRQAAVERAIRRWLRGAP